MMGCTQPRRYIISRKYAVVHPDNHFGKLFVIRSKSALRTFYLSFLETGSLGYILQSRELLRQINSSCVQCMPLLISWFSTSTYIFTNYSCLKYKKRLLLKCIHHLKSDLINNIHVDHLRISCTEPSSVILQKLISDAKMCRNKPRQKE